MNEENIKRAVTYLRDAINAVDRLDTLTAVQAAIHLLDPPKQSQAERIAVDIEKIAGFYASYDSIALVLRNIAAILREKP
jgi:hypothetical protein